MRRLLTLLRHNVGPGALGGEAVDKEGHLDLAFLLSANSERTMIFVLLYLMPEELTEGVDGKEEESAGSGSSPHRRRWGKGKR